MASFTNIGIGLGGNVDVNGLIKGSVDVAKLPITRSGGLTDQKTLVEAKISTFGQLKSLASTLSDAVGKLNSVTGWNAVSTTTSNKDAVTATATGGTVATAFNVQVTGLAKAQTLSSAAMLPVGGFVGAGTLKLEVGKWDADAIGFTSNAAVPVEIEVSATDTLSSIAGKINGSSAGVTATILSDASGERLLLRSKATGEASGFRMSVTDSDGADGDALGLSRLAAGATVNYGTDATATINGIAVSSSSNTFTNTVAGVTFTALKETSEPVEITVSQDTTAVKTNIDAFVKAYNALNQALNEITKYDKDSGTAGLLQGDSTTVALQNTLRNALQSVSSDSGAFRNLSDIGVVSAGGSMAPTGDLEVDSTKLDKALKDPDAVKAMFLGPTGGTANDGVAEKIKAVTTGLLSTQGFFANKDKQMQQALTLNKAETLRVMDRADRLEKSLSARYTALDTRMSTLNALNSYIAQQVTTWNKTS